MTERPGTAGEGDPPSPPPDHPLGTTADVPFDELEQKRRDNATHIRIVKMRRRPKDV